VILGEAADHLPSTTAEDWVTYADHVVVVSAVAELPSERVVVPRLRRLSRGALPGPQHLVDPQGDLASDDPLAAVDLLAARREPPFGDGGHHDDVVGVGDPVLGGRAGQVVGREAVTAAVTTAVTTAVAPAAAIRVRRLTVPPRRRS
jgi:hypothetical protein